MLQRLDVVVLGLLGSRPRTGYDVRKWLDRYGWSLGYTAQTSQIYRHLARLVDRGWATVSADPRAAGPDAKLYGLTPEGRMAFEEWVDSPYVPAERPMDPDFQVRMTFTRQRGPRALLELVRTELTYRRAQHQHPVPAQSSLLPADATESEREWDQEVSLLLSQRGRLLAGTLLTWLETTEERLALLADSRTQSAPDAARQEESA